MKKNIYLALFFPLSTVLSSDIPTSLETFAIQHKSAFPSLKEVKIISPEKLGIQKKEKKAFLNAYSRLLSEYAKIPSGYESYDGVRAFCAIRYTDIILSGYKNFSDKYTVVPGNATYMAFALLTGAGVDYEQIGSREHIRMLALSYGVTDTEVEAGIWETLVQNWDEILGDVVGLISYNVSNADSTEKKGFMTNVILPYLALMSRGRSVTEALESNIERTFQSVFPVHKGQKSPFREYTRAFNAYVQGTPLENRYLNALNEHLKPHGFRIDMDINHCVVYELLDYRIPINVAGIGEVLMKKRLGVSLLGFDIGLATYAAEDVTLTYEYILDRANDISIVLKSDSLPRSYHEAANDVWKGMGISLSTEKANNLYRSLLRKEFSGQSQQAIHQRIIRQVATHEIKHKWDENTGTKKNWYNIDSEISAHLTETIYGGSPMYSLFSFINRIQRYYINISQKSIKEKLKPLIIESWSIAQQLDSGKMDTSSMVAKIRRMYDTYVTINGGKLPSIEAYAKKIINGPLKKIPDFTE